MGLCKLAGGSAKGGPQVSSILCSLVIKRPLAPQRGLIHHNNRNLETLGCSLNFNFITPNKLRPTSELAVRPTRKTCFVTQTRSSDFQPNTHFVPQMSQSQDES